MITAQIIDTAQGRPADRVPIELDYFLTGHGWREVGHGVTNADGLVETFGEPPAAGIYRLAFDVAAYQAEPFFPSIGVTFEVRDAEENYHLVLLLGTFGYSVCRA